MREPKEYIHLLDILVVLLTVSPYLPLVYCTTEMANLKTLQPVIT